MNQSNRGIANMEQTLDDLQKKLAKKQTFESAGACLASFLRDNYSSASPDVQNLMYNAVCRVATLLQTRYSAPGFWLAGLKVFEESGKLFSKDSEKNHINKCISRTLEHLGENREEEDANPIRQQNRDQRFLFEGQLTVQPEPPMPAWLAAQNLLTAFAMTGESSNTAQDSERQSEGTSPENARQVPSRDILTQMIGNLEGEMNLDSDIERAIENALQQVGAGPRRAPPASKEVVAKLPIIDITEEVLERTGKETECAVCKEHLDVGDKMQELPCKHLFHPNCLKPWLDEQNSCPICRYELETDDAEYELRKERDKEAEEERKGAANAIRGGEYMYV